MSIAKKMCSKKWVSHGTTLQPAKDDRPAFYPKSGVTFTCTYKEVKYPAKPVVSYVKQSNGKYKAVTAKTKVRYDRIVKMKVSEKGIINPDPATGKKPVKLNPTYLKGLQSTEFIEVGEKLVSREPITVRHNNKTKKIFITLEIYKEGSKNRMLQRSYWSDNYLGSYCCW